MIPLKRDTQTHVALLYMKMKSSPITVEQLRNFSPNKYRSPSKARQALSHLHKLGFASAAQGCYTITDEGIQALYLIVTRQKKKIYHD